MSRRQTFGAASAAAILVGSLLRVDVLVAEPVQVVVLEPRQGEFVSLLAREVARAAALDRVPFLELTAEWCAPCKALRASFDDPLMQDAFAGTYIIQVDVDA
jgi:thiol:disulfide interchange protein